MRIFIIIIIGIHGIIHLFGFLKAFGLFEFNAISQPISKPVGVIWLLAFILFSVTTFLLTIQSNYWWIIGFIAVLLSQFLIILYWKDAKFGTIFNLVILVSALIAFSTFNFKKKVSVEIEKMHSEITSSNEKIVSEQMIVDLPIAVQNWLNKSGIIGKETIQSVFLEQDLQMLIKPEQKEWNNAEAKQYFTTDPPAFNWFVNLKMNPLIEMVGRDKFENGKGEMIIKLFSMFSVANVKNNEKTNQATLQRYLAEIVWFPTAALSPYITWEAIDNNSSKATMTFNGTKGTGVFYFDEIGYFKKFVAMRYKDSEENSKPMQWTVTSTKTELRNGISIPVELKANWKLDSENWTWLKLKINRMEYNTLK